MDADCSLAASLLALDSEAACELPELLSLLELPMGSRAALTRVRVGRRLVLWEELAVPSEEEAEPAGEAVLSLLEELSNELSEEL